MSAAFPANVIELLAEFCTSALGVTEDKVIKRALDPADPDGSVGIFAGNWVPWDHEIGVPEPMGRYSVFIQTLHKNTDEEEGRRESSILQKNVRVMLYREPNLQVRLRQLNESSLGYTERLTRHGIREQRFLDNVLGGEFVFLSVTELWVETEIA